MKSLKSNQNIFNLLLKQIYTGKIEPGEKLPPLKTLAKELNIDQASLRIALKQLENMNLLDIRRSDGVYVKDFMETGGLDFLSALFSIKEENENESVIDPFLVNEVMEFWVAIFPEITFMANLRYSSLDLKRLIDILNTQIDHVDDIEELVRLDILAQDIVGQLAKNIVTSLLLNSLRPMRIKVTDVLYRSIDKESRISFLRSKRDGLYRQMDGTLDLKKAKKTFRKETEKVKKLIQKSIADDLMPLSKEE